MNMPGFIDERERFVRARAFLAELKKLSPYIKPETRQELRIMALSGRIEQAWVELNKIVRRKS